MKDNKVSSLQLQILIAREIQMLNSFYFELKKSPRQIEEYDNTFEDYYQRISFLNHLLSQVAARAQITQSSLDRMFSSSIESTKSDGPRKRLFQSDFCLESCCQFFISDSGESVNNQRFHSITAYSNRLDNFIETNTSRSFLNPLEPISHSSHLVPCYLMSKASVNNHDEIRFIRHNFELELSSSLAELPESSYYLQFWVYTEQDLFLSIKLTDSNGNEALVGERTISSVRTPWLLEVDKSRVLQSLSANSTSIFMSFEVWDSSRFDEVIYVERIDLFRTN